MAKDTKTASATPAQHEQIMAEINVITQIQEIETQLALNPDNYRIAQLADAYIRIGEYDIAADLCHQGQKIFPDYGTLLLVLTETLIKKGDYKKAAEVLSGFYARHPAHIRAHKFLGDIAMHENDIRKAAKHYRIALRLDPVNRALIQTFMEVRDQYNKIKDSLPSEEDDETVKPVLTITKPAEPVKTELSDKILDEIIPPLKTEDKPKPETTVPVMEEEKPEIIKPDIKPAAVKKAPVKEKPVDLTPAIKEIPAIQEEEEEEGIQIRETEPVHSISEAMELKPVYIDDKGKMYFYEDDEVSFEQYKKRFDLLKAGKAVIMPKAKLDERLAELGIVITPRQTEKVKETLAPKPETEPTAVSVPDETPVSAEETVTEVTAEPAVLNQEIEEEQAFEDVEMSYRDYLDIMTEEDDLLEALMGESAEAPHAEETSDLVSKIVGAPELVAKATPDDEPIDYQSYLTQTTSDAERNEALFEKESEAAISLAEFARFLDASDETLDYETYCLLDPEFPGIEELMAEPESEEPALSYSAFLDTLQSDEDKKEALISDVTTEETSAIEEAIPVITEAKTEPEPAIIPVAKKTEPLPAETVAEKIVAAAESKTEIPSVTKTETPAAEPAAETVEETEEEYEEEIDPREASLELVEKLALEGQFGTAYKVCKMLKLKNPTDAKVDRKILELKRLYLWSTQLVG